MIMSATLSKIRPSVILKLAVVIAFCSTIVIGQTTPVAILKQINRHNEDGSYSYGYENADGSYKIETKHPTGEVVGKYGYVDVAGALREVEYGAGKRGFEPAGQGITVPPVVLHENKLAGADPESDYDDGQYREDPSIYEKIIPQKSTPLRVSANKYYLNDRYTDNNRNQLENEIAFKPRLTQTVHPRFNGRISTPSQMNYDGFQGHPASNFDPYSGSYSINYVG